MDVYRPSSLPRIVNAVNRWTRTRIGQELEQCGQVCTIREVELAVVAVVSNTDPPREEIMPTKIKEVLKEWGCMWMWKLLFRSPGRMPCPNYEALEFQPRTVDNSAP